MAKDPAFLFYSQDFFTGTATMTMEDRGKYITILCLMHQQGRMKEETIRFLVGSISDNLKLKFRIDENGFWYNERLEIESEKRAKFTESRRNNGIQGGRPKKTDKPNGKPKVNHMDNHMEDENDNENEDESVKKELPKTENLKLEFPFSSDQFKEVWKFWKSYKQKQHRFKYKSIESEQAALNHLTELSHGIEETAIEIIKQSMGNGWQGLFELKTTTNGAKTNSSSGIKEGYADYAAGLYNTLQARVNARAATETDQPDRPG